MSSDSCMSLLGSLRALSIQQQQHLTPVLPQHLTPVLPKHLTPVLPQHLTPVLPKHLTPVLPQHLTLVLPQHLTPVLPQHLTPVLPTYSYAKHGCSHRGVLRHEAADSAAKVVHLLQYCTLMPYSKEETDDLQADNKNFSLSGQLKMFFLRNHSLLLASPKCVPEACKTLQSHMSSGKYVSVHLLPPLSKQMITKNFKHEQIQQTEYKQKGIYQLMEMAKSGRIQEAERFFKKLQEVPRLKFGVGVCMALFDMHVKAGNVLEAVDALQRLHSLHPRVLLQPYKVLVFANLLLQRGQTQSCLQLLRDEAPDEGCYSPEQLKQHQWDSNSQCKRTDRLGFQLVLAAAEEGDVALTQRLLDELLHLGYCTTSRQLLAPLVKVHLVRSDYKGALQAMEEIARKYRCLPYKAELLVALLTEQETESLTRVMELSTAVIGRPQAVLDLAIALLEAGKLDKAASIIKYLCKLYVNTRKPQHLHSLMGLARVCGTASEDLLLIRAHLFACHELIGNTKDANDLLAELQREGITKEDLLAYVPAHQLKLPKKESLDEAGTELAFPSCSSQNSRLLQRSHSLPRRSQAREQERSWRSSSVSKSLVLHTDDAYSEPRNNLVKGKLRSRDGRQESKKLQERIFDWDSDFETQSRNNDASSAGSIDVRRSSRRNREGTASFSDVW
ncbi:hypothetical protein FHG87_004105 [Trinorchestia longiramus]|nr:hypothetical protein FHG87_004105 [Trinorchestia longiramus]